MAQQREGEELLRAQSAASGIGTYAVEYAANKWPVFPLRGKCPVIASPHPEGSKERKNCRGECGQFGHGLYDATTDIRTVASWWGRQWAGCNIGIRVPESMFVLDVDNLDALRAMENRYGTLPETLTTVTGRATGGRHLYFRRPHGELSVMKLPKGIEIKTSTGYVVGPPSIHPDTGNRYTRVEGPVATPPAWLVNLLCLETVKAAPRSTRRLVSVHTWGRSIAEDFCATSTWASILQPRGWRCVTNDPESDGAVWLHPAATSSCSATVRNGCLFVYSTSTDFEATEPDNPKGYTKFRAYAVLNHGGDMSAAARALRLQEIP